MQTNLSNTFWKSFWNLILNYYLRHNNRIKSWKLYPKRTRNLRPSLSLLYRSCLTYTLCKEFQLKLLLEESTLLHSRKPKTSGPVSKEIYFDYYGVLFYWTLSPFLYFSSVFYWSIVSCVDCSSIFLGTKLLVHRVWIFISSFGFFVYRVFWFSTWFSYIDVR